MNKNGKEYSETNPIPVSDVGLASEKAGVSAETVTFITGAAGFSGSVSLDKKPITNLTGDKVGSFWRDEENLAAETDKNTAVTAVTETATAATVTINSEILNLEKLFESPAATARAIIEITDASGGTLYGYIGGVAATGNSYVLDIYNSAALTVQSWVGTLTSFTFGTGTSFKVYLNQSSIAWTTGTILTQEVKLVGKTEKERMNFLNGLSNGQYAVDYVLGDIYYKKATTGTSDTVAYSVLKQFDTATIEGTVTVDSEFPAAAALADAKANPTTTSVEAHLSGFNGTTWDRLRSGVTALTATLTGWLNVLPGAIYNATPTERTEGQVGPLQADEDGSLNTISPKTYDSLNGANYSNPIRDLSDQYVGEPLVDTTNVAAATNYYPSSAGMSMDGYKSVSIQGMTSGGVTTTIEATNDDAASPDWVNVTTAFTNLIVNPPAIGASYVDVNFMLVPTIANMLNVKNLRIKSVTSDATNGVQYNVRRLY